MHSNALSYLFFDLFHCVMVFFKALSRLPLRVLYIFSDVLFFLMYYLLRYRRQIVWENIQRSFPEKDEQTRQKIVRAFYHNLADIFVEVLKGLTISETELRRRCHITNPDVVKKYVSAGQTVLVMSSHTCNWEWQPLAVSLAGMTSDVIYKTVRNDFFERLMYQIRSRFGILPIPQQQTIREVIQRKSIPRAIGLVADQSPEHTDLAYWTSFLHRRTDFYTGTEKLARSYGYPVVFTEVKRLKRGHYELTFHEIATPPYTSKQVKGDITERYVRALESLLQHQPADWLWSHNRWKRSGES